VTHRLRELTRRLVRWYLGGDGTPSRIDAWLLRTPIALGAGGMIAFAVAGTALLLANPAGNGSADDESYGAEAPLQGWVVLLAACCFAAAIGSAALLVRSRSRPRVSAYDTSVRRRFDEERDRRTALDGEADDDVLRH
jgi:hypothetical protein